MAGVVGGGEEDGWEVAVCVGIGFAGDGAVGVGGDGRRVLAGGYEFGDVEVCVVVCAVGWDGG